MIVTGKKSEGSRFLGVSSSQHQEQSAVSRLLWDADQKLASLFADLNNSSSSSNSNKESEAKQLLLLGDRNINLRSYTDSLLEKDKHFQEMLRDIERYGYAVISSDADRDQKRAFALYSLLKSVLRECIALADVFERKVNIERVYNWYREKRKRLVELRPPTAKTFGAQSSTANSTTIELSKTHEQSELFMHSSDRQGLGLTIKPLASRKAAQQPPPPLSSSLKLHQNEQSPEWVPRLTQIRMQHESSNGRSVSPPNQNNPDAESFFVSGEDFLPDTPRSMGANTGYSLRSARSEVSTDAAAGIASFRRRNLVSSALTRPAVVPSARPVSNRVNDSSAEDDVFKRPRTSPGSTSMAMSLQTTRLIPSQSFSDEVDPREKAMETLWLTKRAAQTEAVLEEREFSKVVRAWSTHRSRVEEEITRRAESARSSSVLISKMAELNFVDQDDEERPRGFQTPHGSTRRYSGFPDVVVPAQELSMPDPTAASRPPSSASGKGDKKKGKKGDDSKKGKKGKGKEKEKKGKGAADEEAEAPAKSLVPDIYYVAPPSEYRLEQLRECDRIRQALAKKGVPLYSSIIEKGILVPEDRSHDSCVRGLPLPGVGLFANPFGEAKGKKGKKGKAAGKKKEEEVAYLSACRVP
eukprot:ANDGO_02464.mRNA.1 hypothetical protein